MCTNFIFKNHLFLGSLSVTFIELKGMFKFDQILPRYLGYEKMYNERIITKQAFGVKDILIGEIRWEHIRSKSMTSEVVNKN